MLANNKKMESKKWCDYENDEPLPELPKEWKKKEEKKEETKKNIKKINNKFALLIDEEDN